LIADVVYLVVACRQACVQPCQRRADDFVAAPGQGLPLALISRDAAHWKQQ
jgi:hypothetical protein